MVCVLIDTWHFHEIVGDRPSSGFLQPLALGRAYYYWVIMDDPAQQFQ